MNRETSENKNDVNDEGEEDYTKLFAVQDEDDDGEDDDEDDGGDDDAEDDDGDEGNIIYNKVQIHYLV